MIRKYCYVLREVINEKLWLYCGSTLAVISAFITGVELKNYEHSYSKEE